MSNKTIVITGSTRGIGKGLAVEFAKKGCNIIVNGRSEDTVDESVEYLSKLNSNAIGVIGDVNDIKTHQKIIDVAVEKFSKIDIWINNAGIPQANELFVNLSPTSIKNIIDVNIYGLIIGSQIAAQHMIKQGFGKIFNMEGFGSDGRTMKKLSLYGTTKRAVNYFTKSLAKEFKNEQVQIGILSPGMVRTDFLDSAMKNQSEEEIKKFKKVSDVLAEDVDKVSLFLSERVLSSTKNYDRIEFLTKSKLMVKIFKLMLK